MKYVMGVDIGFAHTGISLFKVVDGKAKLFDVMLISTEKSSKKRGIRVADDDIRRINEITQQLYEFYKTNVSEDDELIVFGESPTGGAQSGRAHRAMGIATAIPAVLFELLRIPIEYVTPTEVKVAVTGSKTAGKQEIMDKVCKMVGGVVTKEVRHSKKNGRTYINKYSICGKKFGLDFEHIADSIGTLLHAKKNSTMFRMFVK